MRTMGEQGTAMEFTVGTHIECHCRRLRARPALPVPAPLQKGGVNASRRERWLQGLPLAVVDLRHGIQLRDLPWRAGLGIGTGITSSAEGINADAIARDVVRVRIQ